MCCEINSLNLFRQFNAEFCGLSCGTILPGRKPLHSIVSQMLRNNVDIVFLQIGQNDVGNGIVTKFT